MTRQACEWNFERCQFLRMAWGRLPVPRIAALLGMAQGTVRAKAKQLGLPVLRAGRRRVRNAT